jgi:hypothetical protein
VTRGGHIPGTILGGCIPEFTYVGGLIPSPITGQGQNFHPGRQRPATHGKLTRGMARGGHILLGNHEIAHTNGSTPIVGSYPVQTYRVGKLDSTVEPCPGQRLRRQQDATRQGTRE